MLLLWLVGVFTLVVVVKLKHNKKQVLTQNIKGSTVQRLAIATDLWFVCAPVCAAIFSMI